MNERTPSTIRWGLIGAGNVCEHKGGPPLYKLPNSSLALVYRRDREAGISFVERHGHGRYVNRMEDLLDSDEIDAVYVATPHARHAEQTIAALRAGKPVMVEKPMAINTGECNEMVATARDGAPPIELVDSDDLIELFESLELGLTPRKTYDVDESFFEEFK